MIRTQNLKIEKMKMHTKPTVSGIYLYGNNNSVMFSRNSGNTWQELTEVPGFIPSYMAINPNTGIIVSVASNGKIYSKTFDTPWVERHTLDTNSTTLGWIGGVKFIKEIGRFLVSNPSGYSTSGARISFSAYSDDGINWTNIPVPVNSNTYGWLTYGNGRLIMSSGSNSVGGFTSTNWGTGWTAMTPPAGAYRRPAFSPSLNRWIGVSINASSPNIIYSDDGTSWTNTSNFGLYGANPMRPFWSETLGAFCFQGPSGTRDRLFYSIDGISWSYITLPISTTAATFNDVVESNNAMFLVINAVTLDIVRVKSLTDVALLTVPSTSATRFYSGIYLPPLD